jgi:hypothetical protein
MGCNSASDINNNCSTGNLVANPNSNPNQTFHNASSTGFQLSPNPAKNEVSIKIENTDGGLGELTIFNNLGQIIHFENFSGSYYSTYIGLDDGKFANGDYFVQVKNKGGVTTKKMIVLK